MSTNPRWIVNYDNDTGPDDDGFDEWWTVTDCEKSYRCGTQAEALWLETVLNQHEP